MADTYPPISVGLMGTGEYTTGITPSGQSKSDKKIGVVGVTMFDLRRRGKVGEIIMAGTNGGKVSRGWVCLLVFVQTQAQHAPDMEEQKLTQSSSPRSANTSRRTLATSTRGSTSSSAVSRKATSGTPRPVSLLPLYVLTSTHWTGPERR